MRFSLQKLVLAVAMIVTVQVVLYFWKLNKPKRTRNIFIMQQKLEEQVKEDGSCDYNKCNPVKDGMLNVHLIPHSHDDVGWLKTAEQYFTGEKAMSDARSQHSGTECVRCVLNTTIPLLLANPDRRFIFIEMAFLSRFWDEINDDVKQKIKQLIKDRKLEIAIGGWCMSDAATTFYNDIIDQHTLGFDFIDQHFGKCGQSRVGWHVDQFGHSREHSSIFAQMGFEGLIVGRIDFQDYTDRHEHKKMEFLWKSSASLGSKASLFTHVSYDGYYAPRELQFEGRSAGTVDASVQRYVADMMRIAKERAAVFKTNHLMFPMGADFAYKKADEWFANMDALIKHTNLRQADGSKINLLYSTPSCYLYHVNKEKQTFPTKSDDFFPYAIPPKAYWTGYFTSRAGLKLHVKRAGAMLQTCKELNVFNRLSNAFDKIDVLKKAQGILQHHDAITGTEKEHVAKDYNHLLSEGEVQCQSVIDEAYKMMLPQTSVKPPQQEFCYNLNISECSSTENSKQFVVNVYNPLSRHVTYWVRLPVSSTPYTVTDPNSQQLKLDILPVDDKTKTLPGRKSQAENELVFPAKLSPLGYGSFYVKSTTEGERAKTHKTMDGEEFAIQNEHIKVSFGKDGILKSVQNIKNGMEVKMEQDFYYYIGDTMMRPSGAYVFIPKFKDPTKVRGQNPVKVKLFKGEHVQEIRQEFSHWVSQIIRLYDTANYVELEWQVGPIPNQGYEGREVISHFKTDIKSEGHFYTDSNGREMLKRTRDKRETWKLDVIEPVSGNYYPITSRMFIQDDSRDTRITLMTDRCQAGGSIQDGAMELMVHRRLFRDDGLGVSENLNELDVDNKGITYKGKHYLFVDTKENSAELARDMALELHLPPTLSFMQTTKSYSEWTDLYNTKWSGLRDVIPPNLHVLTLDQTRKGEREIYLLRVEHLYEVNEHKLLSQSASLQLENLFESFDIIAISELSLGANFKTNEVKRMQWKTDDGLLTPEQIGSEQNTLHLDAPFNIILQPMEIRTFHIQIYPRS
ncbi:hypothetical protein SNE40_020119 [Patella caerulea]|uniref:Alpha-mannosidase n=1 Tax=Patella caerulea TaxID=87958 RepID=A0AAN8J4K5_PATCE